MINSTRTAQVFGYKAESLSRGSHKLVVAICDYCGKEFTPIFKNYNISRSRFAGIGLEKDCCKPCGPYKTKEADEIKGITLSKRAATESKMRASCIKKYGVDHISKTSEFVERVAATWAKKSKEELKERQKKTISTMKERYGDEYWKDGAEKRKKTNLERYGVEDVSSTPEIVNKREKTMIERYGVRNFSFSPMSRPRINATWKEKHGTEEIFANKEFQQKIQDSNIEKYGTAYPTPKFGKVESEVRDWLKSETGYEFLSNTSVLGRHEIDMYSPELKIGIEYCGLYWHSQNPEIGGGKTDKNYHYNKWKNCCDAGVRLITIFEDEWLSRQDQVKGYLQSVIGSNKERIFARNCSVRMINKSAGCRFISAHHIQGSNSLGKYFAGIFNSDELVGVMSFGRHPRKNDTLVLDRLCFKSGVSVIGGASRLFKYLVHNTNSTTIISWSDNRWSSGNVYEKMGFTCEERLGADYSYVVRNARPPQRVSKQSQKKSSTGCPDDTTEKEWCEAHKLYRIWDCGKIKWVWQAKNI